MTSFRPLEERIALFEQYFRVRMGLESMLAALGVGTRISESVLDSILSLQVVVAWAGEGVCEPKRLDWWRTDLVDDLGGGDLLKRLLPKTHLWASLEAVRRVAMQQDQQLRLAMAQPDLVRTLFFWGFAIDEKLNERLTFHKRERRSPSTSLPLALDPYQNFSKTDLEEVLRIPGQTIEFNVVPGGREIVGPVPEALELQARNLAAALLPLADRYPMPFYRLGGV